MLPYYCPAFTKPEDAIHTTAEKSHQQSSTAGNYNNVLTGKMYPLMQ